MADAGKTPKSRRDSVGKEEMLEDKMKSGIDEARRLYGNHSYEAAMSTLLTAINLCTCSPSSKKHGKDKSCNISQCTTAVKSFDPRALYKVSCGPCSCGAAWPSCTSSLHAEAVEELAACLEKAGKWAAAFSTALGLIRLDPASAIGYCRVVRIIRYLTKCSWAPKDDAGRSLAVVLKNTELRSQAELRALLKSFIKVGLYNCDNYRHGPDTKYNFILRKMAHSMSMTESLKDPIKKLPREILSIIFSFLDLITRLRCQRVNKEWSQLLISDKGAWADFRVKKPRNPGRHFESFITKHTGIRTLVFEDTASFALTIHRMQRILQALPNLKRLHLGTTKSTHTEHQGPIFASRIHAVPIHLSFHGVLDAGMQLPQQITSICGKYIQSLDIVGNWLGLMPVHTLRGTFLRLRRLRLVVDGDHLKQLWIGQLAYATPHIEHLYLDGFSLISDQPSGFFPDAPPGLWAQLRTIVFGPKTCCPEYAQGVRRSRCAPLFLPKLESLEILSPDPYMVHGCFFTINTVDNEVFHPYQSDDFPFHYLNFPHLRVFRCRAVIEPNLLEHIIAPAARNGTLKVLDIRIGASYSPGSDVYTQGNIDGIQPIPAYDYAYAATESLHTLGLYDFNWAPAGHFSEFDGQPFLDFLKLFPNVHAVAVYPGKYKGVGDLVAELICMEQIKVVYQDVLTGIDWDAARRLARKHGVELKHVQDMMPVEWPDYRDW